MSYKNSTFKYFLCLGMLFFISISVRYNTVYAQSNNSLRLTLGAGISQPHSDFNAEQMFAERGMAYSGSLDYFFNKIGVGLDVGYFTNETQSPFQRFIQNSYLSTTQFPTMNKWETKYALLGPTFNVNIKKLQIGVFVKGGYSQINVPQLAFNKPFFGQTYNIYQFNGSTPDYQFAWMSGINLGYTINNWLGIIGRASYLSTSYLSKIDYTNTYRDANDDNRNGVLEDNEYLESRKVTAPGSIALSVINPTLGIQITLGKPSEKVPTQMTRDYLPIIESQNEEIATEVIGQHEIELKDEVPALVDQVVKEEKATAVPVTTEQNIGNVPALETASPNSEVNIANVEKIEPSVPKVQKTELKTEEIPEVEVVLNSAESKDKKYDAPEAKYDEEAAALLYKAGELYFASNDFESAIPCFNKLKANPDYPRSAYMFALSLSAMGNCSEAKTEYDKFKASYKGDDMRTLEIIFSSQLEICKTKPTAEPNATKSSSVTKKYTIQFIAIRKANQDFPNLSSIGNVETEFFPNKSVYRYVLGEYSDLQSARIDAAKVKKMGFRDAFIAEYENDVRVNTLDHFKN